jgi:flagellin-specific chaperone FliS
MKVTRVYLHALRGEEHFQLMTTLMAIFIVVPAQVMNFIGNFITALTELLQREDKALEKIRKSTLTDPIAEADELRDMVYRSIVLMVEAYLNSVILTESEAARRIRIVIDHYGNITRKNYNEETAAINNFIGDLRERCSDDLLTLNLTSRVNELESKNQEFNDLMNRRFEENAQLDDDTMREIRRSIDALYQQIIACLEVGSVLPDGEVFDDVIRQMNSRLEYYKTVLAQRKGKKDAAQAKKYDET